MAAGAVERFLKRWPEHEKVPAAKAVLEQAQLAAAVEIEKTALPEAEALDLLRRYETMLLLGDHGQYRHAVRVGEQLQKKYPQFTPAGNSLAQLALLNGDWQQAEAQVAGVVVPVPE